MISAPAGSADGPLRFIAGRLFSDAMRATIECLVRHRLQADGLQALNGTPTAIRKVTAELEAAPSDSTTSSS